MTRTVARKYSAILRVTVFGVLLSAFAGFQRLPRNVASCPITPTPPSSTSVVPPAQEPPPAALCGFPLTIPSPGNGAIKNSPVPLAATATPLDPIYTARVYVDGFAVLYTPKTTVNQLLWMPGTAHFYCSRYIHHHS